MIWPKMKELIAKNDITAVRDLLVDEIEKSDEDTFVECFNHEDRDEKVRDAAKEWAGMLNEAAKLLAENNDAEALDVLERASNCESDFGDNPSSAHLVEAAKWLVEAANE